MKSGGCSAVGHVLEDAPEALAVGEVAALEVEGQRVADDRVVAVIDRRRGADRQRGERHDREPSAEADCGRHARKPTSASSVSCPHREQPRRSRRRRAAPRQPALPALRRHARDRGRRRSSSPTSAAITSFSAAQSARGLHGAAEHGRRASSSSSRASCSTARSSPRASPGRPPPRVRDYARRRVLRIVPAYWVALTVLAATVGLCGVFTGDWWVYYGFLQNRAVHDAVRDRRGVVAGHRGVVLRRAAAVGVAHGAPAARAAARARWCASRSPRCWRSRSPRSAWRTWPSRSTGPRAARHHAAGNVDWFAYGMVPRARLGGAGRARARVARRARDRDHAWLPWALAAFLWWLDADPARHAAPLPPAYDGAQLAGRAPDLPAVGFLLALPGGLRRPAPRPVRAGSSATRCWRGSASSPTASSSGTSR